jgi:hypothetical protein
MLGLMNAQVGFDESGNTGQDLLNLAQPVYALASVHLPETEARELLRGGDGEPHFVKCKRSSRGRAQIMEILTSPAFTPASVKVSVMHKSFMLTSKLVDLLIEPVLRSFGVDMYSNGAHLATSNLLHTIWPVFAPKAFAELQSKFVAMFRYRRGEDVVAFNAAIRKLESDTGGRPDWAFDALKLSHRHIDSMLSNITQQPSAATKRLAVTPAAC